MKFFNRVKWVLGILMIFLLVIATNLIDRKNFSRVKDSVVTIYEDRLVVNDIIFELSRHIQEKEIAVITSDSTYFKDRSVQANTEIQGLIAKFEQTKLTTEEAQLFQSFKDNMESLIGLESYVVLTQFAQRQALINKIADLKENLYRLTKIQLNEGGRQTDISKKAINTVELFTQLEIYILIILAILVQIIIIYKPKQD